MEKINLQKVHFFQNLNILEQDFQYIYSLGRVSNLNRGNFLFFQGDQADNLHILLSGRVKVYKTNLRFEEIVINFFEDGSSIAEMPFFENIQYPATAVVESKEAVLLIFSRQNFKKVIEKYPEILYRFISSLAKKIKNLDSQIENIALLSSEQRIAKYILEHWIKFKDLKRKDIAFQLNITPEHLSRVLNKFKKLGIELDNDSLNDTSISTLKKLTE